MTDPKPPVPFSSSDFDLSVFDVLMPQPAQDTAEPDGRPESLREPWQGVLEIERDQDPLPSASHGLERAVYLSAEQAEGDVWWNASGLLALQAVMDQDFSERHQSAGHEFVIVEDAGRTLIRSLADQLTAHGVSETVISAALMDAQIRLAQLETLPGRAMTELARYRMRADASALARLSGHPEHWPLLLQPER